MKHALVIGAGPAGLMAAEQMADAHLRVTVADAMPSVGRKFLMAGKSGLNLTKDESLSDFLPHFHEAEPSLRPMLTSFGPVQMQGWARALGQEVFTGSSGRVFPKSMKTSPLLRNWLRRLAGKGVNMQTRWRWQGWAGQDFVFDTPDGRMTLPQQVCVLALGGASWSRLGSDGAWSDLLRKRGASITPFQPANMGFQVDWSPYMARFFGAPVKGVALQVNGESVRGEFIVSERGLEGGGIYAVSRALRGGARLSLDLLPDWDLQKIQGRMARPQGKATFSNYLRKSFRLSGVKLALLQEFARPLPTGAKLAGLLKSLPVPLQGPRPMDEAISTAGGVRFDAMTSDLELKTIPGVFCAGEMLDWEAPTGGYLLTACLATGRWAGKAAAQMAKH